MKDMMNSVPQSLRKAIESEEKESKELETIRREDERKFVQSMRHVIDTDGYIKPMA